MNKQSSRKQFDRGGSGGSYGGKPKKGGGRLAPKSENKIFTIVMACIIVLGLACFAYAKLSVLPVASELKTPATIVKVNGQKMPGWLFDYYENAMCINSFGGTKEYLIAYYDQLFGQIYGPGIFLEIYGAGLQEAAFESLVDAALVLQAAKELGLTVDRAELEQELADLKASIGDTEFKKWLEGMKLTEERLLYVWEIEELNLQLFAYFANQTKMSDEEADEEAENAFAETPEKWAGRKSSHILIEVEDWDDEEEKQAAYALAMEIIEMLNEDPERFAELAKEFSEDPGSAENGGFYDAVVRVNRSVSTGGQFVKEYVEALFELAEAGDYTLEPVESEFGYHIIRFEETIDQFEDLKETIINDLNYSLAQKAYADHMSDLFKNAKIVRKVEFKYWTDGNK
ncbi:MAG: peptidylprolyl isomerase [Clostridiales bacterium]|nr:peptidylprolyl isomerase [Clostridiales bacterium]